MKYTVQTLHLHGVISTRYGDFLKSTAYNQSTTGATVTTDVAVVVVVVVLRLSKASCSGCKSSSSCLISSASFFSSSRKKTKTPCRGHADAVADAEAHAAPCSRRMNPLVNGAKTRAFRLTEGRTSRPRRKWMRKKIMMGEAAPMASKVPPYTLDNSRAGRNGD